MRSHFGVVALVCLLATGCGNGGEDTDAAARFTGSYWMHELYGGSAYGPNSPGYVRVAWGTAEVGEGEIVRDLTSTNELIEEFPPIYYSIREGDHAFQSWNAVGTVGQEGGVSPYAQCVVASEVLDLGRQRLLVMLRKSGIFNDGTLSGDYHLVGFEHDYNTQGSALFDCILTFDGAGHYSGTTATENRYHGYGRLHEITAGDELTYAVAPDGLLTMDTLRGGGPLTGGLVVGGVVALVGGPSGGGHPKSLHALIETATNLSEGWFEGDYWTVGVGRIDEGFRCLTGFLRADGVGGYQFWGQENVDYALTTVGPATGTYAVEPNGRFTLGPDDGGALVGGLGAGGKYFALGGGTDAEDDPMFVFGVRK